MFRIFLITILACTGIAADEIKIPEIEGPRTAYQKALADIRAKRDRDIAPANKTYAERLAGLHEQLAGEGDKDAAMAVKAEQERAAKSIEPTAAEVQAMTGRLRALRNAYEKERNIAYLAASKMEAKAHAAWASGLAQLQERLTKSGDLKKAAIVKAERDKLAPAPPPSDKPTQ